MVKVMLAAAIGAIASAPLAFAQDAPGAGQFLQDAPNTLRLTKVRGAGVMGLDHTRLGSVEDLLIGRDGKVSAVVVSVGGVLGMGGKYVALPFAEAVWNTGNVSRQSDLGASTPPGQAGSAAETLPGGVERMPGAQIGSEVLNTTAQNRSGDVNPASGPVMSPAAGPRPTVLLVPPGGTISHLELRASKGEAERAPEFRLR